MDWERRMYTLSREKVKLYEKIRKVEKEYLIIEYLFSGVQDSGHREAEKALATPTRCI